MYQSKLLIMNLLATLFILTIANPANKNQKARMPVNSDFINGPWSRIGRKRSFNDENCVSIIQEYSRQLNAGSLHSDSLQSLYDNPSYLKCLRAKNAENDADYANIDGKLFPLFFQIFLKFLFIEFSNIRSRRTSVL